MPVSMNAAGHGGNGVAWAHGMRRTHVLVNASEYIEREL